MPGATGQEAGLTGDLEHAEAQEGVHALAEAESVLLSRLAETLPAINWPQTVSSLERQHPPWILRGKSADLIQLPNFVLGKCDFARREIILKLVEAFRSNYDRGYHRFCQEPCERETCRTTSVCFCDRSHYVEDLPGPLFVHVGKVAV